MSVKRNNFDQRVSSLKGIVQLVIGVCYLMIGGFVIQKQWLFVELQPYVSLSLGIVLIIYGLFRMYRAYDTFKQKKESN